LSDVNDPFELPLSRDIWKLKYRFRASPGDPGESSVNATWDRVARALAGPEATDGVEWARRFRALLDDFRFLPGGRILAGAGAGIDTTLFNCFVMGRIEDSLDGIFEALREGAVTMQRGGGVGYDFSTLRPAGSHARVHGAVASGPVSFMGIWDSMCATMLSTGNRRGAMMATLRCDHPDIEAFIDAKRKPGHLTNFNLSVLVSNAFMEAVQAGADWPLVFPASTPGPDGQGTLIRDWPGYPGGTECRIHGVVKARELWERLMRASYDCAEPGVLFTDRINNENNLGYRERISATNPCGEIPLPPYGACNLGSVNLATLVTAPFSRSSRLHWDALDRTVTAAVRMLDNVIDASDFPLPEQADQARGARRIGLGITGLGDALIFLGLRYDSDEARSLSARVLQRMRDTAYRASVRLSVEKGAFPFFDREPYLHGAFLGRLPDDIRDGIARDGIRNSHLLAIAPAGTISLLANNVSNGLEPVFAFAHRRRIRQADGSFSEHDLSDYAWRRFRELRPSDALPDCFVEARELPPAAHLRMQAALQPFVDNAISKTINIPEHFDADDYASVYFDAWRMGLKGCTTFRPNPVTGEVLSQSEGPATASVHCCSLDREPG
jgi:ribonucleoside-diphosphate reductase alpha chain